jgi:hypothetical protein
MVAVIILNANGESKGLKTSAIAAGQAPNGTTVAKALRKTKAAETIGTYKWKGATLTVWGWKEGKAGTENKHELPPPLDEVLLFGDALVTNSAGDISTEDWATFYDAAFGGFEETGSSTDSDSDSESGSEAEAEEEEEAEDDEGDEGDDDKSEASASGDEEDGEDEEEDEEEEEEEMTDDDCYDDGEEGGGSKRRAPRRRAATAPEYRRLDMGLRSRIKLPTIPGKRAPRWQTAPELVPEEYTSDFRSI